MEHGPYMADTLLHKYTRPALHEELEKTASDFPRLP
jgi:hypothetical protein